MATYTDDLIMSNDLAEIKQHMTSIKMRMIKLVASMIHLFDWMDSSDIIYQQELRQLMEEYLIRKDNKIATGHCSKCSHDENKLVEIDPETGDVIIDNTHEKLDE